MCNGRCYLQVGKQVQYRAAPSLGAPHKRTAKRREQVLVLASNSTLYSLPSPSSSPLGLFCSPDLEKLCLEIVFPKKFLLWCQG